MAHKTTTATQEKQLVDMYLSGLSIATVSKRTRIGTMVITRVLKDHGIARRPTARPRPYHVNSFAFDDLSKEHAAYWLGFLYADGSVNRTNISLGLGLKDLEQAARFARFLRCEKEPSINKANTVWLSVSDRILADKLVSLGIATNRPMPLLSLKSVPPISQHHFLRGWLDGDGCIGLGPQIQFVGKLVFLEEVQKIFIECTGAQRVTIKAPKDDWGFLVYKGIYRCTDIVNYLYRDATVYLERKHSRFLNWKPPVRNRSISR